MGALSSAEVFQVIFGVVGGIISILLVVVAFFLRKLVHKVDLIDPLVVKIQILAERLTELCDKVEELGDLRVEMATIKARFLTSLKTRHGGNGEVVEEEENL